MSDPPLPLRLLVADEDPVFARFFTQRMTGLAGWSVTVESCSSGAELVQRIYAETFDLVFVDLGLPDIDGLDFLTRLFQTTLPLPVVALSAKDESRNAVEAMKRGVLDHVMKEDFATMDLSGFLGRLTETFRLKRENAELRQISEMKNDFLATISHELRTPLTSILGLSELILAGRMGPVGDKQADGLRKVIEQSQNLARLINQLLDVQDNVQSRARADLTPVDLVDLINERMTTLRPMFEKKRIGLRGGALSRPVSVQAQTETIGKVLDHLILNALKFTNADGVVEVSLHPLGPKTVRVCVQDTGQGIRKEALPFVFQKFFHADPSLTRGYGGLGLGLAYCQFVVESYGGKIWVESPGMGKGTVVNFTLPCLDPMDVHPSPAPRAQPVVLWVDDNVNMLELMEAGFASLPETVQLITRQSGQAGLDAARSRPPDLMVLDIMMPDLNGLEVLSQLKADPETRNIPVMIVTGYREAAEEALDRGATAYFLKPFRIPDVLEKILKYLKIPPPPQK